MPLLTPSLGDALLCRGCSTNSWTDHVDPGSESTGTIECTTCHRHYLVVETIPVLHSALDAPTGPMKLGDRVRCDPAVRALLKQALGRFHNIFGSVERALAACSESSLEEAFTIPQAPWINLSRFTWPKFKRVVELCGAADTVLDVGCGYGPSAASFVLSGSVRSVIGIDENLYLLLLFRRYARASTRSIRLLFFAQRWVWARCPCSLELLMAPRRSVSSTTSPASKAPVS
jgi:hypothetical protein